MNPSNPTPPGYTVYNRGHQPENWFQTLSGTGRTLGDLSEPQDAPDGTPISSRPPSNTPSSVTSVVQQTSQGASMPTAADFTLAIFATLVCEFDAVEAQLDGGRGRTYHGSGAQSFSYKYGKIWGRSVLLIKLLEPGPVEAGQNVQHLLETYKNLQLILLVGVCAGVAQPPKHADVFIGDVIIGTSVQFYGNNMRWEPSHITSRHVLKTEGYHYKKVLRCLEYLKTRATKMDYRDDLARLPEAPARRSARDRLFLSDYHHVHRTYCPAGVCVAATGEVCSDARSTSCQTLGCSTQMLIAREDPGEVTIHVGPIASAPFVMRSPAVRDGLARDYGVLAFEMESTGLWDAECPVVPIKGVSDFADSHKDHEAQEMAAAMAACVMRTFVKQFLGPAPDYQTSKHDVLPAVTLQNNNVQPILTTFPPPTEPHHDKDIQAPPELHDYLSDWYTSTAGENLLLWGDDRNGWLEKAVGTLASMEGNNRAVHIRCGELVRGESFYDRVVDAICRCCCNLNPQCRGRLGEPGCDAVGSLDRLLGSVLPVLIYGLDDLPGHAFQEDIRNVEVLRALIQADHFKVLFTASYEVSIGDRPDGRTTEVDIGGWWATQTLHL